MDNTERPLAAGDRVVCTDGPAAGLRGVLVRRADDADTPAWLIHEDGTSRGMLADIPEAWLERG